MAVGERKRAKSSTMYPVLKVGSRKVSFNFSYLAPILNFPPTSFGHMVRVLKFHKKYKVFDLTVHTNKFVPLHITARLTIPPKLVGGKLKSGAL